MPEQKQFMICDGAVWHILCEEVLINVTVKVVTYPDIMAQAFDIRGNMCYNVTRENCNLRL